MSEKRCGNGNDPKRADIRRRPPRKQTAADDPNIENFTYSMRSLFLQEDNLLFNTNSSFAGPRFVDVVSVSDYWKWVKGPMLHAAYMTDWYRGDPWTVGDQDVVSVSPGNVVGQIRRSDTLSSKRSRP